MRTPGSRQRYSRSPAAYEQTHLTSLPPIPAGVSGPQYPATPISRAQKNRLKDGFFVTTGAGNETRTRDPDLGKVVLYQLSYSRKTDAESGVP